MVSHAEGVKRPSCIRRAASIAAAALVTFALAVPSAQAAPSPSDPGGIEAPTSPAGVPSGPQGPEFRTFAGARAYAGVNWGATPAGANDFSCKPKAGQSPIVLVPGTGEDAFATWSFYAPQLASLGYCVYTFNYNPSLSMSGRPHDDQPFSGEIRSSAAFLATFVDRVLASTGAEKVTLIGHSLGGGPLPRSYLKWYGGDKVVDHLIGLVPSNHGTTMYGISMLYDGLSLGSQDAINSLATRLNQQSLAEQLVNSPLNQALAAGGDTIAGVRYTVITTRFDQVVLPYSNAYLSGDNVTNVLIQKKCPMDTYTHLNFTYDTAAFQVVRNALDPEHAKPISCAWIPPRRA